MYLDQDRLDNIMSLLESSISSIEKCKQASSYIASPVPATPALRGINGGTIVNIIQNSYLAQLYLLHQTSTVDEFQQQFEAIRTHVSSEQPELRDDFFTSLFINGLCPEVRTYVQGFHPCTVIDAYDIACIYEYSRNVVKASATRVPKRILPPQCSAHIALSSEAEHEHLIPTGASVSISVPSCIFAAPLNQGFVCSKGNNEGVVSYRELPIPHPGNHENVVLDNCADVHPSIVVSLVDSSMDVRMETSLQNRHCFHRVSMPNPICSLILTSITDTRLFDPVAALPANVSVAALKDASAGQFSAPLVLSDVKDKIGSYPIDTNLVMSILQPQLDDHDKVRDKGGTDVVNGTTFTTIIRIHSVYTAVLGRTWRSTSTPTLQGSVVQPQLYCFQKGRLSVLLATRLGPQTFHCLKILLWRLNSALFNLWCFMSFLQFYPRGILLGCEFQVKNLLPHVSGTQLSGLVSLGLLIYRRLTILLPRQQPLTTLKIALLLCYSSTVVYDYAGFVFLFFSMTTSRMIDIPPACEDQATGKLQIYHRVQHDSPNQSTSYTIRCNIYQVLLVVSPIYICLCFQAKTTTIGNSTLEHRSTTAARPTFIYSICLVQRIARSLRTIAIDAVGAGIILFLTLEKLRKLVSAPGHASLVVPSLDVLLVLRQPYTEGFIPWPLSAIGLQQQACHSSDTIMGLVLWPHVATKYQHYKHFTGYHSFTKIVVVAYFGFDPGIISIMVIFWVVRSQYFGIAIDGLGLALGDHDLVTIVCDESAMLVDVFCTSSVTTTATSASNIFMALESGGFPHLLGILRYNCSRFLLLLWPISLCPQVTHRWLYNGLPIQWQPLLRDFYNKAHSCYNVFQLIQAFVQSDASHSAGQFQAAAQYLESVSYTSRVDTTIWFVNQYTMGTYCVTTKTDQAATVAHFQVDRDRMKDTQPSAISGFMTLPEFLPWARPFSWKVHDNYQWILFRGRVIVITFPCLHAGLLWYTIFIVWGCSSAQAVFRILGTAMPYDDDQGQYLQGPEARSISVRSLCLVMRQCVCRPSRGSLCGWTYWLYGIGFMTYTCELFLGSNEEKLQALLLSWQDTRCYGTSKQVIITDKFQGMEYIVASMLQVTIGSILCLLLELNITISVEEYTTMLWGDQFSCTCLILLVPMGKAFYSQCAAPSSVQIYAGYGKSILFSVWLERVAVNHKVEGSSLLQLPQFQHGLGKRLVQSICLYMF